MLALVLLGQGVLLRNQAAALVGLVVLGAATFVVVPLLQTWLMTQVGQAAAGLVAAVNISVMPRLRNSSVRGRRSSP